MLSLMRFDTQQIIDNTGSHIICMQFRRRAMGHKVSVNKALLTTEPPIHLMAVFCAAAESGILINSKVQQRLLSPSDTSIDVKRP